MEQAKWGEFFLKDLFTTIRGTRLVVANRISGTRALVTAGFENTGVAEFIGNLDQKIFPASKITIDMFGNSFYRDYEFSADDNILVLYEKTEMSKAAKIAISSIIHRSLLNKYSYGNQFRLNSFNKEKISLPITAEGKIDFPFMESFIKALEAERIKKLEDYLISTGLSHYQLTPKEEKALDIFTKNMRGGG
ncbi:restriction endonuclease subunit S [Gallibacterium genomosp. 3]|uniref:restriction endonuclease subunit S n=1 Tax=Gallibacterium genomosp. 3 TaxID=505345 RepID=UPI0009F5C6EF|nr:restriction endonuclease subunit S [Gallibacterium genomosp. 3]